MEIVKGKLNCFFVDKELKWGADSPDAIFINATEEEFNKLMDDFVSKIEAEGDEFSIDYFRTYAVKSGYYAYSEPNIVIPPYAPL